MGITKVLRTVAGFGVLAAGSAFGALSVGQSITNNTAKFAATAKNMGQVAPSTVIDVSIWLNPHNKTDLDSVAKELYDPTSPSYRHWLSKSEIAARYAPTAAEAKTVQEFFASHNLKVVAVGPNNFYVRARGTVANVNSAFHVQLSNFEVNGTTYRSNVSDPFVEGEAGAITAAVSGLDNLGYKHPIVQATSKSNKKGNSPVSNGGITSAAAGGSSAGPAQMFTTNCFSGKETERFDNGGSLPVATYTGNGYAKGSVSGCGYTPQEIYTAYNLNGLYKEGFDGTGQTIVIIDWCGSPTIKADANAFSAKFGLPALTAANFSIIPTPTATPVPPCEAPDPEINIDVEWAHAIAPGAAIDLVVPPSPSFQDIDEGVFYAIDYGLGNVISGSYGAEESEVSATELIKEDLISEIAAVSGISTNFSSGDDGDFTFDEPQFYPASVSSPASSPWATAVGGVSLALKSNNTIAWQTGWGTNETLLVAQSAPFDPPLNFGFDFGSGGGPSGFFAKPSYQKALKGKARQLPDISWLGDPFTGAVIAISEPFVYPSLQYTVYGGTSLACPMFSALWAIANQEAGTPLGQAAPYLYTMPAGTITDVLAYGSATNVTGKIEDSTGTTAYSAAELIAPLENTTKYYTALWDYPLVADETLIISFGTDSGLTVTPGWDNVTGVGTPNGKAFADAFKQ